MPTLHDPSHFSDEHTPECLGMFANSFLCVSVSVRLCDCKCVPALRQNVSSTRRGQPVKAKGAEE